MRNQWGSAPRDWGGWGTPWRQMGHQALQMCPVLDHTGILCYCQQRHGDKVSPAQHACQPHASARVLCPSALMVPCPHR